MHELALNDAATVEKLIELCTKEIPDQQTRSKAVHLINEAKKAQKIIVSLDTLKLDKNHKTIPLAEVAKLLIKLVMGDTEVSQIEEISRASSTSVYTGKARALGTYAMRQDLSRSIVSAAQTSTKCIITHLCRNFHTQGILRMKNSAIS